VVTDEEKLFQKNGIDPQMLYLQTTLGQTAMIAGEPSGPPDAKMIWRIQKSR
jgi:hypothetical protein